MNSQDIQQKVLGKKGLMVLIFFLNMTAPMSTDLYLSAFPTMITEMQTTSSMLNLTLVGFFISFALGMLFIGPLSDKYGRKPILLTGLIIYGLSSLFCSWTNSIEALIIWRIVQALGAGGMVSVSTAMVKDAFIDEERPSIIATLQMLGAFAPTVAPLIGAQIIQYFSWRETFDVLAILSLISLVFTLLLTETLPSANRLKENVFKSIGSLQLILVNKPYMMFLLSMGGTSIIYMSFLAISSYIYISFFALNETTYSLFFACNSLVLMVGPRVYLKCKDKLSSQQVYIISMILLTVSALLLLTIGTLFPYIFLISFIPVTFTTSFLKSFATNILLGQPNMNAGGASSIINFSNTALGSLGMLLGTLGWKNHISGLACIILIGTSFSIILWLLFQKKKYSLKGL